MITTEATTQRIPTLQDSIGDPPHTIEQNIPENVEWIDDAFYVKKTRYGLHTSVLKEPLGAQFITAVEYDACLSVTRWHLKCLQDGTLQNYSRAVNTTSGVKL
jgi:hypothetical protein